MTSSKIERHKVKGAETITLSVEYSYYYYWIGENKRFFLAIEREIQCIKEWLLWIP
jgi:hypothetical protein